MTTPVLVGSAIACGLAAALLTPLVRRIAETPSRWLTARLHIPLALLGGAGAAALATSWVELVAYALLALGGALLVVIDLATLRLPDVIVGALYAVLALLLISGALSGEGSRAARAAAAAGVLFALYLILGLLRPQQLGLGDVKLAGVLGGFLGWFGWPTLLAGTLAAFLLGGLAALALLLAGLGRRASFPFGPVMIAGAAIGAVLR